MRVYDPRIARWFSVDPLAKKYPYMSPYSSFGNDPLNIVDEYGLDLIQITIKTQSPYIKGKLTIIVDKQIAAKVKELVKYAIDNKIYISINSSFRSTATQEKIQTSGRTPAKPGHSNHEVGVALDFQVYKNNSGKDEDIISKEDMENQEDNALVKEAKKMGFRWGGDFTSKDGVHIDTWPKDEKSKYGYSDFNDAYETNQADYSEKTYEKEVFEYNGSNENSNKNSTITAPITSTTPTAATAAKGPAAAPVVDNAGKKLSLLKTAVDDVMPKIIDKVRVYAPTPIVKKTDTQQK